MTWIRSSFCESSGCVEVTEVQDVGGDECDVLVRDSKIGDDSPVLQFSRVAWRAFADAIKNSENFIDDIP